MAVGAITERAARVDRSALHPVTAARHAIVIGVCVSAGVATDHLGLSLTAGLGALLVGLQDQRDFYARRITAMSLADDLPDTAARLRRLADVLAGPEAGQHLAGLSPGSWPSAPRTPPR